MSGQIIRSDFSPAPSKEMEKKEEEADKIDRLAWDQLMVEIRRLEFSYDRRKKFMQNVDMSVPTGAIYGLLGPSGCGKTTLLKMILGLKRPNSGYVKVNGRPPGAHNNIPGIGVGFMPQELSLYRELTLKEALTYFGKMYGLTSDEITSRIKLLVDFLDLPDTDRRIEQMSGGQQRRVSLSLSLVHNPPLLILDEPTVGTDPVLRERIWDHLIVLSQKESTTVIITTHYIEEARRAHVVAFMREGNILVEHSPPELLAQTRVNSMEDVFLKLCRSQSTDQSQLPKSYLLTRNDNNGNKVQMKNAKVGSFQRRTRVQVNRVTWIDKVMAQFRKNYIRIIRNKTLLVFETILPAVCIIIFSLCIGTKPSNLKVTVYNREFLESNVNNTDNKFLSVTLLESISKKTVYLIHRDTAYSAIEAVVGDNSVYGALLFNEKFSECLFKRFMAMIQGTTPSQEVIDNSTVQFYADSTDMVISQTLFRALFDAQIAFQRLVIKKYSLGGNTTNVTAHILDPLISVHMPPVYGSVDPQFRDFMAPGVILSIIFILACGLTALTLVIERKEGQMERTQVAGVNQIQIMAGQCILQFFVVCVQITLLMIFAFLVFRITIVGNIGLAILIILLQGISGMSYGLTISAISTDENTAIMAALGTFYPQLLLSGIIWPLEGMPSFIRQISYFLPQTLPILAFRNIMLKGWGLTYSHVYLGFLSSMAWICVFLLMAVTAMKIRDNPFFTFMCFRKNK